MNGVSFHTQRHKALSLLPSTGYGQSGPYAQAAGYDVVIEAEAGLMHM